MGIPIALLILCGISCGLAAVNQIEHVSIPWNPQYLDPSSELPIDSVQLARNVTGLDPEQIHLTYYSAEEVVVSWATGEGVTSTTVLTPAQQLQGGVATVVFYGTTAGNLSLEAQGYTTSYTQTYEALNATSTTLNYSSPLLHHTPLQGLEPSTTYFYQCGDPQFGLSAVHNFTTAPPPGPDYPFVLGVVADVGQTLNSSITIQHLSDAEPNFVVLIGDLTYADDSTPNGTSTVSNGTVQVYPNSPIGTYQPRWDAWYRMMQPLLSRAQFLPTSGNHELEPQYNGTYYAGLHPTPQYPNGIQFQSYLARNPVPYNQSGSTNPLYYSVDLGPMHIIHLTNYDNFAEGSPQYNWLVDDLTAFNRQNTPWLVATWHAPWYSSYTTHYKETECMRQSMEDLLYENGVDVVFNGHLHTYERSNPVYNYTVNECGTVHIVIGDGGNIEGLYKTFIDQPGGCPQPNNLPKYQPGGYCPNFAYPGGPNGGYCSSSQPDWSAFRQPAFGHGIFTIENSTHAYWQWNRNLDSENVFGDEIYIIRDTTCPNQQSYGSQVPAVPSGPSGTELPPTDGTTNTVPSSSAGR